MVPFYNTGARFVDAAGRILRPWIQYLQQFTTAPPAFMPITVGASPFSYTAKEPGNVYIDSSTAILLTRGIVSIDLTGLKIVPVSINDIVTVTYSGLPVIKFIPSYGQNTTS